MKPFLTGLLVVFLVALSQVEATAVDPTRQRLIDCMLRYIDTEPQDGGITSEEIDHAKNTILTPVQRTAAFVVSTPTIMNDCDFDRDGKISRRDMELSTGSCLNAPWKIAMADKYICKQAAQKANRLH